MDKRAREMRRESDKKIVLGIKKKLAGVNGIPVAGKMLDAEEAAAMFQAQVDRTLRSERLYAQFLGAIADEDRGHKELKQARRDFRNYVVARYGGAPSDLDAFGFEPDKVVVKSVETKKLAAEKARQTRKARHTMGKRQKEKIKGVVPAEPPATEEAKAKGGDKKGSE